MDTKKVLLKHYDCDKREEVQDGEVSTYHLAKSVTLENFAEFFEDWVNSGGKGFADGRKVGKMLASVHPHLQKLAVDFALGLLAGICSNQWRDARNAYALELAKTAITQLIAEQNFYVSDWPPHPLDKPLGQED